MNSTIKTPYRRGADNGIIMGLWLSGMMALWSYTIYDTRPVEVLSLLAFAMMLLVPFVLFAMLWRTYRAEGGLTPFSSLWVEGIMTFIFGSLISVIVGYVWMRLVQPTFLNDLYTKMLASLNDAASQAPKDVAAQYRNISANFHTMMERGELPGAIELLLNTMWFVTFSGCILSLIVAAIVRAIKMRSPIKKA